MTTELRFLLNDQEVRLSAVRASDTLLGYLREERRLTGTKEGCAEGDCGACTVLVGRLGRDGLIYEPVNACIRFLASLHGQHVVTIEYLKAPDGGLHPVQRAMVDHHASQCGFCTPGIVMSLCGLWMTQPDASDAQIEQALQGNLCRCTGYAPIIRAAQAVGREGGQSDDLLQGERDRVTGLLRDMQGRRIELNRDGQRAIIPADTDDLAEILAQTPDARLVAGATDVGLWVTKQMRNISPAVFIGHLMKEISETETEIRLGAGVTYSEAAPVISSHFPAAREYWNRIGGWQVRNMGTIGANIANGSPIGDTPPLLIALGARLILRHGMTRREIALHDFFIDYGKQDLRTGEFVEQVVIPTCPQARIAAYKISKRSDSDISAVAAGFCIALEDGRIADARIAFGGMAATPKRASHAEAALTGQPFSADSFAAAADALADDFQPLTDWRASAEYRLTVATNLFRRFWLEQSGTDQPVRLPLAMEERA
ncbi:xanthine dehydrogenase small subunit [Paracoccus seriniphilus]|uniref:Xanthine dehydrogenase small subunit n=1 Tax=Paracoccus seriniphilus TaxID=184748 RepID=A0A239PVT2_9RHOB|nr:xanthine dehydrogenase small subunit [Paracoccus seriniphilus]WCR13354.1 xanthine dehydrogenase small subunit [Paracoccus seriniphilus]SNT74404.1 xanthine dehydrogenase small subunit [Paracoccus seriniphilus]